MTFDAANELDKIKKKRKERKFKHYTSSKLDDFNFEILKLNDAGATLADLQCFLSEKHIQVVPSTIHRWLKKNV